MKVFAVCFAFVALTSGFKIEAKKTELITRSEQCYDDPDTTDCPGGCCPHPNRFCCADNINCAPTSADCRLDAKMAKLIMSGPLVKMAKIKQCDPDETNCFATGGGKHFENFRGPQNLLVGPIWGCFSSKITLAGQTWVPTSLPAISKVWVPLQYVKSKNSYHSEKGSESASVY